jgi:hypothetical protein
VKEVSLLRDLPQGLDGLLRCHGRGDAGVTVELARSPEAVDRQRQVPPGTAVFAELVLWVM